MKNKKSVLIITFPQGGPFVWAQNLAKEMRKRGFVVTLASGRKEYVRQQFRYYDIVHTCVPLPNLLCGKYILTIKGNYKEEKLIGQLLFPLAVARATRVTVPSQFLKKSLGIQKAQVIANGVYFSGIKKESYAQIAENPKLGIMTNFDFKKKADGLLNLAKIVHSASPQATIVIAGDGRFFPEYEKAISEIHSKTEFLGRLRKEDFFRQIDIFTYYSFLDNQPNAVLEAMAYGLPVVSNAVGAMDEMLDEKYICRTDDAYVQLLHSFLSSQELRKKCGQDAMEKSKNFSWEKVIGDFLELY